MRLRTLMLTTTLAFAVLLVPGAPAATLWTTPAHTTYVGPFGFPATSPSTTFTTASGTSLTRCQDSTLTFLDVFRNTMSQVALRSFNMTTGTCGPTPATFTSSLLTVFITGTSTTNSNGTCWPSTITNVNLDVGFTHSSGDLTTGVTACQPTVGTSPVTLRLNNAGTLSAGLRIDAAFTLTGAAATFSLTD